MSYAARLERSCEVAGLDRALELERSSWDAYTRPFREAEAAAFSCVDAAAQEQAATVARGRPRKGAGLVSVSTTDTRPARGNKGGSFSSPVLHARCQARGRPEGVYVPPSDEKGTQRVRHLRRAVGFAARAHAVGKKGFRADWVLMVTLTYARGGDWRPEHVSRAIKAYREWCRRAGVPCRYVWVAELQKRGVIHYHVALWLPVGMRSPKWDVRGWWPHGCTNVKRAEAAVPYLMKYLSKGGERVGNWRLPSGARMYGVGGLDHSLRRARRWLGLPGFVRAQSDIADDWRRVVGGGWRAPDGSQWPSEYERCRVGPFAAFERVQSYPRPSLCAGGVRDAHGSDVAPVLADGPFSWLSRGGV